VQAYPEIITSLPDGASAEDDDSEAEKDSASAVRAVAANDSAVEAMGKDELKVIAAELVTQVRKRVTIDWTLRESARAKIKVLVKRILRKHGYPPDLQDEATKLVLAQAELLCAEWAA
jgi:type I restriction enzyme R subunit